MVCKIVFGMIFLMHSVQLCGGVEYLSFEISDGNLAVYLDRRILTDQEMRVLTEKYRKIEQAIDEVNQDTFAIQHKTIEVEKEAIRRVEVNNRDRQNLKIKKAMVKQQALADLQVVLADDENVEKEC